MPTLLRAVTVNRLKEDLEPFAGREASVRPKEAKLFNELALGCRALAASIMVNAGTSVGKQMIYDSWSQFCRTLNLIRRSIPPHSII